MSTIPDRVVPLALVLLLLGLCIEPALANKFETIGSGVSGSMKIKVEYLRIIGYVCSGIFLVASLLTVATQKHNAHELNYSVWKPSSIVFLLFSIGALVAALLL